MNSSYRSLLKSTRLYQVPKLAKRILGMKFLKETDFLSDLSDREKTRLSELAMRATGEQTAPPPILVFGVMPRSGSNFLRDVLAEHVDVYPDPGRLYEFPLLHVAGAAGSFMDEFIAMFPRNQEVLGRWDALAMLAGAWMRELQVEAGDKSILLKCPHVQNLHLAPVIFPNAKIVLCLRDGRDIADSTLKTFKRWSLSRKTLGQIAHEWALGAEAILSFEEGRENADENVLVVRYEDLVETPETVLPKLLEFTQLDPERFSIENVNRLPVRGSSRSANADTDKWLPQEKQTEFKPIGRWEQWSRSQKVKFSKIAQRTLFEAGYD